MFSVWKVKKSLEAQVALLDQKVKFHEQDHQQRLKVMQSDHEIAVKKLKAESDQKIIETQALSKLEMEQKVAEVQLRAQANVNAAETKAMQEKAALESKLAKEYYDKMTDALKDMTLNGSEQSKFVQELALKMFDKGMEKPMPAHHINETRVVAALPDGTK